MIEKVFHFSLDVLCINVRETERVKKKAEAAEKRSDRIIFCIQDASKLLFYNMKKLSTDHESLILFYNNFLFLI